MYSYITCCPDIGYAVTTLLKFSSAPTAFHYKLLKGFAKYLQSTIDWGIHFHRSTWLEHPDFSPSKWHKIANNPSVSFDADINQPLLMGFVDAAYAKDLCKRWSTTGLVYTFCGGDIVYKSKTQSLTAGSSTERMVLKQLGFKQIGPT